LRWTSEHAETITFQLQESRSEDFKSFKIINQGYDLASVISGKANGDYFYRIATSANDRSHLSNVIKVTVAHHPLNNAIVFFIAGAIVFFTMLVFILKGNREKIS